MIRWNTGLFVLNENKLVLKFSGGSFSRMGALTGDGGLFIFFIKVAALLMGFMYKYSMLGNLMILN